MIKNRLVIRILVFVLAVGLMGAGSAFGLWPFSSEEESTRININTADQATLLALPGVEEAEARAIIEYRQKNGPFKTVEEVKNVPGIEEQVFANIKAKITVGEGEPSSLKEPPAQSQVKMTEGKEE